MNKDEVLRDITSLDQLNEHTRQKLMKALSHVPTDVLRQLHAEQSRRADFALQHGLVLDAIVCTSAMQPLAEEVSRRATAIANAVMEKGGAS